MSVVGYDEATMKCISNDVERFAQSSYQVIIAESILFRVNIRY